MTMSSRLSFGMSLVFLVACGGADGPDGVSGGSSDSARETASLSSGALSLSPIFNANMVLQQNAVVPVFGTATPGSTVVVDFQGQNLSVTANGAGAWVADLAAMAASAVPSSLVVSSGPDSITVSGVQVGEVWLCSGQSNMGRSLSSADGSAPYIAAAANHNLRLFRMTANNGPATTSWQVSNSTTAASFSAVCYWMGLDLSQDLDVPIGLVQATLDGSDISEWQHTNGGSGEAYDIMVASIQPFAVKGVLWYQGESNGGDVNYQPKLTDMIAEWRGDWGAGSLPFGIVQLPASKWTASRIAQFNVSQTVADTYLAVTHDLPGGNQLHPTTKYPVGIRSSIGARGAVYGESIVFSGPTPAATSFASGNTAYVNFEHVGNGLSTNNGSTPGPFQIAGATGQYVSATVTVVGNQIQLRSNRVSAPKRVRYAFSGAGNLTNTVSIPTEGGNTVTSLPASLFEITLP